jgi:hypothetical protein
MIHSSAIFETAKLLELYATFSEISRLRPLERNRLFEKLRGIADKQFNGRVEKPIVTSIYLSSSTQVVSGLYRRCKWPEQHQIEFRNSIIACCSLSGRSENRSTMILASPSCIRIASLTVFARPS